MSDTGPKIELAGCRDLDGLVPLVRAYHEFEHVVLSDAQRVAALKPLLTDASLGRIWLIRMRGCLVGYIAVCFGYSIEFIGKDAFVDEFFIEPGWRGRGIGSKVLTAICREATRLGIVGEDAGTGNRSLEPRDIRRELRDR